MNEKQHIVGQEGGREGRSALSARKTKRQRSPFPGQIESIRKCREKIVICNRFIA